MSLNLDSKILGQKSTDQFIAGVDAANAIFDLPNSRQLLKILGCMSTDQFIAGFDAANTIFDLPNSRQALMHFHALVGFPTKETFTDAVRAGNYATWPGLTTTLISKHFPDSDETQKGHMKG